MSVSEGRSQLTGLEWRTLLDTAGHDLSDEERAIAASLAQGKTQAAIAVELGIHRSAVWRRVKAITARRRKALAGINSTPS